MKTILAVMVFILCESITVILFDIYKNQEDR